MTQRLTEKFFTSAHLGKTASRIAFSLSVNTSKPATDASRAFATSEIVPFAATLKRSLHYILPAGTGHAQLTSPRRNWRSASCAMLALPSCAAA